VAGIVAEHDAVHLTGNADRRDFGGVHPGGFRHSGGGRLAPSGIASADPDVMACR